MGRKGHARPQGNILKMSNGCSSTPASEVAKRYPDIAFDE